MPAHENQPEEEWRPVVGHPDYEVSDQGRVMSYRLRTPRLMTPAANSRDYMTVTVRDVEGHPKTRLVHHLVAEAFIGPRPEGQEVRHLDGVKQHNALTNLQYGSRSENVRDQVRHGHHQASRKTQCKHGHPFDEMNTQHYRGQRRCRACVREYPQRRAFAAANIRSAA